MKKLFSALAMLIYISIHSFSQVIPLWLRYSSISPDGKNIFRSANCLECHLQLEEAVRELMKELK